MFGQHALHDMQEAARSKLFGRYVQTSHCLTYRDPKTNVRRRVVPPRTRHGSRAEREAPELAAERLVHLDGGAARAHRLARELSERDGVRAAVEASVVPFAAVLIIERDLWPRDYDASVLSLP